MRARHGWTPQGRSIAVIGGGNGIGREVVRRLVAGGARVAVGDRDATAAVATAAELTGLGASTGGTATGRPVDVTDSASVTAFLDAAEAAHGPVDAVVNSAGVLWVGPFLEEPEATVERQIAVNLLGAMRVVRLTVPRMTARGGGHVLTLASMGSLLGLPGESSYTASKHGVMGYLKSVERELRGSGVAISAVLPAVVDTELARGTATAGVPLLSPGDVADAVLASLRSPRLERTVPSYAGALVRLANILPDAVRTVVNDRMVPDNVKQADRSVRAAYEARHVVGPGLR